MPILVHSQSGNIQVPSHPGIPVVPEIQRSLSSCCGGIAVLLLLGMVCPELSKGF